MKATRADREVQCCLYCGRDTTSKSQVCVRCTGPNDLGRDEERGRKQLQFECDIDEDDYGEDSNAEVE